MLDLDPPNREEGERGQGHPFPAKERMSVPVAGHHSRVRHWQRWQDRLAGHMSVDAGGDFRCHQGQGAECDPDRTGERTANDLALACAQADGLPIVCLDARHAKAALRSRATLVPIWA